MLNSHIGTFTDSRDGSKYKIVRLRDGKWWFAENLRYAIPGSYPSERTPPQKYIVDTGLLDRWESTGRLYTWAAAKRAAPEGWHLPTDDEWSQLLSLYGGHREFGTETVRAQDNDTALLLDEMNVRFGGHVDSARDDVVGGADTIHSYFNGRAGARFWTSSHPWFEALKPEVARSGLYYILLPSGVLAQRSQENAWKAFSVRCVQDAEAQSLDVPYETSPFVLPNPIAAMLWRYGIAGGKVYSRRIFGLGESDLDVSSVVDVCEDSRHAWGIWGDVIFMNQVKPVVEWKNVFLPKRAARRADRVVRALRSASRQRAASTRSERQCPFCAEPILEQAKLCKHCGQAVEPTQA